MNQNGDFSLVNPKLVNFSAFFEGFHRVLKWWKIHPLASAKVWTLLASKACRYATMVGKVWCWGRLGEDGGKVG